MDVTRIVVGTVVLVVGLLAATIGADFAGSDQLALALAVVGTLVAFASPAIIADGDSEDPMSDERFVAIYHRGGFFGWYGMMAVATTVLLSAEYAPWSVTANQALLAVLAAGLVAFAIAVGYFERAM